jgi:O-antigen/teichoic acid export membrane protein
MSVLHLAPAQTAARNALGLLAGTVGEGALQFIFVVLVSRSLGPESFGFWGFGVALTGYLLVAASFGLPQIVVREIAKTPSQAPQVFGSAMGLRLLFGLAICGVVLAVVPMTELPSDRRTMLLVLALGLLVMPFDLAPYFDALQRSRWDALFRVSARTIAVGGLGLAILMRGGVTLPMAAMTTLGFLVCNVGLAWAGTRQMGIPLRPRPTPSGVRWIFKLALPIFWARVMSQVYVHTNLILLGFISTDRETGFYAVADRVLVALLAMKAIVYRLLIPILSEAAQDKERLTRRLETVIPLLALAAIPGATAVILIADPLIQMIFGDVFSPAITPFRILAGYLIFTGVGSIFGATLFATGRQREYSLSITVGSVTNLVLCFVLIPFFGAVGAAVSSAVAEIVVLAVSFRYFRTHLRPAFGLSIVRTVAASAAMVVAFVAVPLGGTWAFAGKLFVGAAVAVAVLWVTGELNPARIESLRSLFHPSVD